MNSGSAIEYSLLHKPMSQSKTITRELSAVIGEIVRQSHNYLDDSDKYSNEMTI